MPEKERAAQPLQDDLVLAHAKGVLHQVKEWVDGLWSVKALLPLDDEVHVWRCRAWPKWLSEMCDRTAERLPHLLLRGGGLPVSHDCVLNPKESNI